MTETQTKTLTSSLENLPFHPEDQKRISRLNKKIEESSFEVAFCGHFSAGKSTLLNRLLGSEMLPTSPIPTSANIIAIQNGSVKLEVTNSTGEVETWEQEIPWNQAKKWGMDGEGIHSINLFAPLPFLTEHGKILDTPGVDSTDPNHQLVTTEQLYTTDLIVYVSDYNHVQSETNIEFLKKLAGENKPIILVINQIDKHDDKELTLQSFENAVRSMLAKYEIKPVQVFFTSMKHEEHPFNQYEELETYIKAIIYNSSSLKEQSMIMLENAAVYQLMERVEEEKHEKYTEWEKEMDEKGINPEDARKSDQWQQTLLTIEEEKQEVIQAVYKERNQLFKNVILFPYTTTEKAQSWLESNQKNFKVGMFFSKRKTEAEKQHRMQLLLDELNEKVKTQLLFHIRNLLLQADTSFLDEPAMYEKNVQKLSFTVDESLLLAYATTSEMDRNFVYTYTKKVTDEIVKMIKTNTNELFSQYEESIKRKYMQQKNELETKLHSSDQWKEAWEMWKSVERSYDLQLIELKDWLSNRKMAANFSDLLQQTAMKEYPDAQTLDIPIVQEDESVIGAEAVYSSIPEKNITVDDSFMEHLQQYLERFQSRKIFTEEKEQLNELVDQYNNNSAVISLFGAFSAGKSSFINAMLGEDILPVSPHPTTAAVNRVKKSSETHPHKTVIIYVKDEEFLDKEIKAAARELSIQIDFSSIEQWKKPNNQLLNGYQRMYADYLYTLQQSIRKRTIQPGTFITTTLEELKEWVAKEDRACMIKEVVIYFDCDWTKKGLELVDTPGVNSIHGRHTNVAFEQLKRSDAIFYLTYYNHAFSKADQVFLQQIGRANENFETDKLFFIINAADLAATPFELNGVTNHVNEQLRKNGITEPRLFALSSKEGLKVKQHQGEETKTGQAFLAFEETFSRSTWDQLKVLHLKKIRSLWENIYDQTHQILNTFTNDEEDLKLRLNEREALVKRFLQKLSDFNLQFLLPSLEEEIQQQCAFLKERTAFIVQDYFPHAVNPSTVAGSTKKQQKSQLNGAIQELEGFARKYISQEQETILIRIEEQLKRKMHFYIQSFLETESEKTLHIIPPSLNVDLSDKILTYDDVNFNKGPLMDMYHSNKDFFENKKVITLKEKVTGEVQRETNELLNHFESEACKRIRAYIKELNEAGKNMLEIEARKETERAAWMFDTSRRKELEEEYRFIKEGLLN
ncbi:dynamin family protein [Alteribacillus sp. YIM 98480]|uniref:dynamin family protein n=1 Tax=Alteribacillus sp. YIM 98480 TaxID=2606599 RepID=UPI00131CC7BD|nr:dynamin family protein [Alteribacillus sp. YIM 98480]